MSWIVWLVIFIGILTALLLGIVIYAIFDHVYSVSPILKLAKEISNNDLDDLIRQGFSEKKIDGDGSFDCVIVGSGIGGLSTAALLSRRGMKVLLLEQHDVIGGCTHSFVDKGYEFDTGIHYIGGEVGDRRSVLGYLFDLLTLGSLKWSKFPKEFDVVKKSKSLASQTHSASVSFDFDFSFSSEQQMHSELLKSFPTESSAISSYFRLARWAEFAFPVFAVVSSIPGIFGKLLKLITGPLLNVYFGMSSFDVLSGITKNIDLIGALTWCYGNHGLPPKHSPFIMTAIMASHYSKGAYYPTGGTANIAKGIVPTILAAGGKAYVRAPVSRIILDSSGSKAIGVEVRGKTIFAPIIVSAAGALATFTKLIPADVPCPHADKIRQQLDLTAKDSRKMAPSVTMFSVFVGLKGNVDDLKLPASNMWLYPHLRHDLSVENYKKSISELQGSSDPSEIGNYYLPLVFISFSSAKDSSWAERYPDRSVAELLTVGNFDSFAVLDKKANGGSKPGARGTNYDTAKSRLQSRMVEVFKEEFPHLESKIDYVSTGTPLTNNFYIGSSKGEIYGIEQSIQRFQQGRWFLQPKQPIEGLYLSGQDALCNGLAGALFGGVSCAAVISKTVAIDLIASFFANA
jgi:all-trans-retinol 13,14-reductase